MDDRRKWMGLNCLTNVGVEVEEPKLEGQRSGGASTTRVIDVPPLAWSISCSFTGQVKCIGTPLVFCVPVGVRNLNVEWIVCGSLGQPGDLVREGDRTFCG